MTEKKLIPFDLERALAGDKVVTGDGRTAIEIHILKKNPSYPIVAVVQDEEGQNVETYTSDGKYIEEEENINEDLFMAPKLKTYWLNVYKDFSGNICTGVRPFETKELSEEYVNYAAGKVKTISFEVEVDE